MPIRCSGSALRECGSNSAWEWYGSEALFGGGGGWWGYRAGAACHGVAVDLTVAFMLSMLPRVWCRCCWHCSWWHPWKMSARGALLHVVYAGMSCGDRLSPYLCNHEKYANENSTLDECVQEAKRLHTPFRRSRHVLLSQ